jgi:undecaprenyl-diphosphatase
LLRGAKIQPDGKKGAIPVEWIEKLDQEAVNWVVSDQVPGVTQFLRLVTHLGDRYVLYGLVAVLLLGGAVAWLVWRRQFPRAMWQDLLRAGILLLVASVASFGFVEGVKRLVMRPRPPAMDLSRSSNPDTSPSFPSGHAFGSAAIYGTLAMLATARLRRRWQRSLVEYAALVIVLLVGFSRMYLGAHYLTDVLAGWAGGLGCALFLSWLDRTWAVSDAKQPELQKASGTA